jgi:hypothetical protein
MNLAEAHRGRLKISVHDPQVHKVMKPSVGHEANTRGTALNRNEPAVCPGPGHGRPAPRCDLSDFDSAIPRSESWQRVRRPQAVW